MKRNKSNIFILSTLCLTLCSCNNPTKLADLFYAYTTENLMSDWNYLNTDPDFSEENETIIGRDHTMRFNCLKGENEGSQLIIHANRYINSYDFELPTLEDDKGNKIESNNFTVAAAWYMEINGSNEKNAYSGFYPDALIPLANMQFRRMNYILKDRNQALYFNLITTEDMPAGTYKGSGVLTLDDEKYDIPFEVTIYDATLSSDNHLCASYLIWYDEIVNGERQNATGEMSDKYFDFVVSKRISPDQLPTQYTSDFDVLVDTYTERVAKNPKISLYRLPVTNSNFSNERVRLLLNKLIAKNLALRTAGDNETDLFKKLYFYVVDEPTGEMLERVRYVDKTIFDAKKELSVKLDSYPDLKESFLAINNIVTTPFSENLIATNEVGGVQTWCPQYHLFNSPEARETYKQRQHSSDRDGGENVWWYGCMTPASPYPSYHLDADVLNTRTVNFMQYDYEIEARIYWNVCWYSKQVGEFKTSRDIWYDPITWLKCAGDGILLYPGLEFGVNGPITTLRLENILSGNEEYEYLYMINEKVQEYNSANGTSYETNALLQKFYSRLFTNMITIADDVEFNDVRIELLKIIEALNLDLSAGMNLLLGNK